ncbi:Acetyltransferase (GNAT) family protein [Filimonas lacunae]|uniref:Acetyltransferase (GNAT) family protein n=1 Tax=Filimonas lacunae TaxID=477680 RepID=A0A173MF99_9BACT|nr:acetyltransferase, GNAT family [Filimonas lacunae]SIT25595.1 Acetyltransferase (GNAT) family protein [Filimonas lacunae]
MIYTTVTTHQELEQIHALNKANVKQNFTADQMQQNGFLTWLYSLELLQQLHQLAPSVIAKDGDVVAGYALVTPREAAAFHADLQLMISHTDDMVYNGKPLKAYDYYIMGGICVHADYRGQGLVNGLYLHHKTVYSPRYFPLVTEISTSNTRSQAAHEKVGFRTIHTYNDGVDDWNVVVWDWA